MSIIANLNLSTPTDIALSHQQVLSARSFDIDGSTVIAILTSPIYLKSERDKLATEIVDLVNKTFDGKVYVTYDTEVYRKIRAEITDDIKRQLLTKVTATKPSL